MPDFFGKAFGGVMQHLAELGESLSGMLGGAYHNFGYECAEDSRGIFRKETIIGQGRDPF